MIYRMFDGKHIDLDRILDISPAIFIDRMGYGGHFVGFSIQFQLRDDAIWYEYSAAQYLALRRGEMDSNLKMMFQCIVMLIGIAAIMYPVYLSISADTDMPPDDPCENATWWIDHGANSKNIGTLMLRQSIACGDLEKDIKNILANR